MYSVQLETRSLFTPDGIRLDADVYSPQGLGEFPILLMRQPYGRAIASTVVYAHPQWYAQQGYIVVIQDVRGRGTSQGNFELFRHEVADGAVTVNWAAALPGSTGAVGMYGFSYQGMTQLYAASAQPLPLKTICPAMLATDLCQEWAYEGGAFCFQQNLAWAIQLAAETARRSGDSAAFTALFQAARSLPVENVACPGVPDVLAQYAPDSFYFDWLAHPDPQDPYWQKLNPDRSRINLPMLHIGGWFDPYLRGTLGLYHDRCRNSGALQHLWIGAWAHLPWGQQAGAVDYGSEAQSPMDQVQMRWFDHFLKGKDTGLLEEDPVHCFDLGTRQWWTGQDFPGLEPTLSEKEAGKLTLLSSGLGAMRRGEGKLVEEATASSPTFDILVQDPWRPMPALGGHGAIPAGSFNRQALDDRSDGLTYTTEPLREPLRIFGTIGLRLYLSSPNRSFDVCAILSVVQNQGVFNFSQGYRRGMNAVLEGSGQWIEIALQPTCRTIAVGEALRLSITAACFPAYALNPGTGSDPHYTPRWEAQVITLQVHRGNLILNLG